MLNGESRPLDSTGLGWTQRENATGHTCLGGKPMLATLAFLIALRSEPTLKSKTDQ